jgi:hypothetical protein
MVKELSGHKNLTMTMRYAHHYPESLRHAVEMLDKKGYVFDYVDTKKGLEESPKPLICLGSGGRI